MDAKLQAYIDKLNALNFKEMYNGDFFLTWEKSDDELEAVFTVADALRYMRENNISTKVFESGLGISLFRDNSTRTRFSFASACNLLGLEVQDLDEGKSQVAHGETVRETANMISFMADVIGIRDDMYIGKGNKYMHEVVDAVTQGNKDGILEQKPTLVNLQCDIDHPTQAMADMLHIIHEFGGVENLKGKKIAMSWAYSPSYGKPLSVPQGIIGLMTRFGMDVVLAHPEGYEVFPEVEAVAAENAKRSCLRLRKLQERTLRRPAVPSAYPMTWQKHSKMLISYIQRAGLLSLLWKNVQNSTATAIQKGSKLLKKNSLLRTQNTKTGLVQKNLWLQQRTAKLFTCTACQLTSQA